MLVKKKNFSGTPCLTQVIKLLQPYSHKESTVLLDSVLSVRAQN